MPTSWHNGGLFIGMHWLWWLVWILTLALLVWALWRVVAERSETRRRMAHREQAEAALRQRFADGEIDEDELLRGLEALLRSYEVGR